MPAFKSSLRFKRSTVFYRYSSSNEASVPRASLPPYHAALPSRRLLSVHGQDTYRFLQGLITANLSSSPLHSSTNGQYSAFLNAQGRVLYDVFIYRAAQNPAYRDLVLKNQDEPGLIIEVDANEVENLARHLKRFKLRAKVGIEILDDSKWGVWARWPGRTNEDIKQDEIWLPDGRASLRGSEKLQMGDRVIRPRHQSGEIGEEISSHEYNVRRMMLGVAEGQSEIIKESALPQESNIDYMMGLDYRKGCYVGQELTIRTFHTGVVRKRILPVQLYDTSRDHKPPEKLQYDENLKLVMPPKGANITRVDGRGRSAGKWLGGVGNIGLALCRLEAMTDTMITTERIQWSPGHEFKVAWEAEDGAAGREVKIKAFVPEWHTEKAESLSSLGRDKAEAQSPHLSAK